MHSASSCHDRGARGVANVMRTACTRTHTYCCSSMKGRALVKYLALTAASGLAKV